MLCETLTGGEAVVLLNFSIISQPREKLHRKGRKNILLNKYDLLPLLLTCHVHEAHVGMTAENSPEKNLCASVVPGRVWPNTIRFQNTLHVSCGVPGTCPQRISVIHLSVGGQCQRHP